MSDHHGGKDKDKLVDAILNTYEGDSGINFIDVTNLPVREKIIEILDLLVEIIFPGYTGKHTVTQQNVREVTGQILEQVSSILKEQIKLALCYQYRVRQCPICDCEKMSEKLGDEMLDKLPKIREMLKLDVGAAFDGDPAAQSFEEIVISYPGIVAIATHRIAHELYMMDVPLIPRMMSETSHTKTGIDIHPGATIGKRFFIDHGTGVVIGETTVIGDNVKLYQSVTLGAMSFQKDEKGRIVKGGKRHPTIGDNVTIYAEATILGDIKVGDGAVISANAWVRKDVPDGVTVVTAKPKSVFKHHDHEDKKNKK